MNRLLNRRRVGLIVAVAALMSTVTFWQSPARAGQTAADQQIAPARVATVDIDLIFQLDEFKEREVVLRARQAERQKAVDNLQDQIDTLSTRLKEDELTEDEKNEIRIRGTELEGQLKGYISAAQAAMQAESQQLATDLYNKLTDAVDRVANRMNLDLVLVDDTSLTPPQALNSRRILYRNNRLDISDLVLNDMNVAFEAGANP